MRAWAQQLPPNFWAFLLGLGLFALGLYMAWPPLAPLGAGLVLMGISLFGRMT